MASRFGEMLQERRRERGLSIQQVANTIKIRPQIIEFFENGDFASMPPRGYAQGMVSSYARFLGLNPREIVNMYFDELRMYEQATGTISAGQLREAAGYASPRSADDTGRFLMVNPPRSRYGVRPPQAGYVPESRSDHEPQRVPQRARGSRALPQDRQGLRAPMRGSSRPHAGNTLPPGMRGQRTRAERPPYGTQRGPRAGSTALAASASRSRSSVNG